MACFNVVFDLDSDSQARCRRFDPGLPLQPSLSPREGCHFTEKPTPAESDESFGTKSPAASVRTRTSKPTPKCGLRNHRAPPPQLIDRTDSDSPAGSACTRAAPTP